MIKNILAVRNDRFGEFLLNIPAFRALKQGFPGSDLTVIVNPYVKDLIGYIDVIDEVIIWENRKHSFLEVLKFSRELKKKKFDLCAIFNPSKEFNIISFLAMIPVRLGYNRKMGFLLTHKAEDKKYLGTKHEIDYNLELVSLVGAHSEDKSLSLKIDDSGLFNEFKDSKTVVIHPWTSDPVKQWPIKNFLELAMRLSKEEGLKVVIVGGPQESALAEGYFGGLDNIVNLTGRTTLKELAMLLKKSKLLVSADSGPVHLASCVGIPVVVIFRNDLPGKTATRWGPRSEGSVVIEKSKLADITVTEVLDKTKEILKL